MDDEVHDRWEVQSALSGPALNTLLEAGWEPFAVIPGGHVYVRRRRPKDELH